MTSKFKILFVSSGNNLFGVVPLIHNQGESLRKVGIEIEYYTLKGTGFRGYLSNILPLHRHIKNGAYNIIHAHYALSGITASLATGKPVISSLMGSDLFEFKSFLLMARIFSRIAWRRTIVKTEKMKSILRGRNVHVIPNGIDFNHFKPLPKERARTSVGFSKYKKYILFPGNPDRKEKNYSLAQQAIDLIDGYDIELLPLFNKNHGLMPSFFNAADLLLMTSLWEGSPNVIKEAMACNCPVVSVEVGDVKEIISGTRNCYLVQNDAKEIARTVCQVLEDGYRSDGRERIFQFDEGIVAQKIKTLYSEVYHGKILENNKR